MAAFRRAKHAGREKGEKQDFGQRKGGATAHGGDQREDGACDVAGRKTGVGGKTASEAAGDVAHDRSETPREKGEGGVEERRGPEVQKNTDGEEDPPNDDHDQERAVVFGLGGGENDQKQSHDEDEDVDEGPRETGRPPEVDGHAGREQDAKGENRAARHRQGFGDDIARNRHGHGNAVETRG